jgi:hypothetical protein
MVEDCTFVFSNPGTLLVAAGILASGDCTGLRLVGNHFNGAMSDGNPVAYQTGFAIFPTSVLQTAPSANFVGAWLDDAILEANVFDSLTVPILAFADFGLVRLESNNVRASSNGFLLLPIALLASIFNMVNVTVDQAHAEMGVQLHNALFYALANPSFQIAAAIFRGFPLPRNFDLATAQRVTPGPAAATDITRIQALFDRLMPAAAPPTHPAPETESAAAAAPRRIALSENPSSLREHPLRNVLPVPATIASLNQSFSAVENQAIAVAPRPRAPVAVHVIDNNVQAQTSGPYSGFGLIVASFGGNSSDASNLAGNTFVATGSSAYAPVGFVVGNLSCTVAGNIILNEASSATRFWSLWVLLTNNQQGAITGNVMRRQVLFSVPPPPPPLNSWNVLNSISQ